MATITTGEVLRLARLSRLELTAAEVDVFTRQLGDILEFARQVNAVDTSSPETAGTSRESQAGLRDDELRAPLDRHAVLDLAPEADLAAGLFIVPRVLNE